MKTYLHINPKWLRTAIGIIVLLFTTAVCNVRAESVTSVDTMGPDTAAVENAHRVLADTVAVSEQNPNNRQKDRVGHFKALTKKIVNHKHCVCCRRPHDYASIVVSCWCVAFLPL